MVNLHFYTIILFIFFLLFPAISVVAIDIITSTTPLTLNQTLVSNGQVFELGFFDPAGNGNLYIGIWYKQTEPTTYVWVANRDIPVNSSSPKLTIGDNRNLILLNEADEKAVWMTSQSVPMGNYVGQLLDSGNFVLRPENDENPESYVWESFKFPTDTLLPGMKLGWDRKTGVNRFLQSWKTTTDPGFGDYTFKMNIDGFPEFFLFKNETGNIKPLYRCGAWNGKSFSGNPQMETVIPIEFRFVDNVDEISYFFEMKDDSIYSRLVMNSSSFVQRLTSVVSSRTWKQYWTLPRDDCDRYQTCGPFGVCDATASSKCNCMTGFRPRNQQAWDLRDGSDGCVRSSEMDCESDGFMLLKNMKLPESLKVYINRTMNLSECAEICRRNCSCGAYANKDITRNGSGCIIWSVALLDMRHYADSEGRQDLYVRAAASDLERSPTTGTSKTSSGKKVAKIASVIIGICVVIMILLIVFYLWRKKMKVSENSNMQKGLDERSQNFIKSEGVTLPTKRDYSVGTTDELDLPLFDFSTLVSATNNFSDANKLGQGGFGCVYKGILMEGEVVAIKRLSRTSFQGVQELKNEVILIAKLQHRNLVRLLGCCIEVEEKLLVYEYMENKSLDMILFDKKENTHLDWHNRFNIISGIARGILYLHQDSRLKIIHRDLKASNILLDKKLNPKISDFGLARIFGGDQTEAETNKVVGTHGYMSPEYAMEGIFSIKSDVFSFGILVLEILSSKKNKGFYYARRQLNLVGHMWNLWNEGTVLELIDESIGIVGFSHDVVLRCVQIGLLCVQENAEDRPDMLKVLLMLSGDVTNLPQPKCPGFGTGKREFSRGISNKQDECVTLNELTASILVGR